MGNQYIFAKLYFQNKMQSLIENAWNNRELLKDNLTQQSIREIIEQLDKGTLRVAEPTANGWQVNE